MNVYFHSPAKGNTGFGRTFRKLSEAVINEGFISLVDDPNDADIQVSYCQPFLEEPHPQHYERKCDIQLLYTTFESPILPDGWINVINTKEGLLTTSEWCREIFKKNDISIPIDVIHHGVDANEFPHLKREWGNGFTFLWQGVHPDDRKGAKLTEEAFKKLRLPETRLVLKWVPLFSRRYYENTSGIIRMCCDIKQDELISLLKNCHCSVNPTRAEGFGLIPLEHMATGMPVIVTDYSGCNEYVDNSYCYPLEPKEIDEKGAVIDFNDLCDTMMSCYQDRMGCEELGKRASKYVHSNWTWKRAAGQFTNTLEKYII